MSNKNILILPLLTLLLAIHGNPVSGQISWTNYTYESTGGGLESNDVYAVGIEPNSNGDILWMGCRPNDNYGVVGGLFRFNVTTEAWTHYTAQSEGGNSPLPHNWVMDLAFDSQANMWIGTKGGGLAKVEPPYENNNWTVYGQGSGIGYTNVYEIAIDPGDNIWLGHGPPPPDGNSLRAMSVFDGNDTWQTFGTPTLAENAVYTIVFDGEGKKWCATKKSGIYILNDGGTPFDTGDDQWTRITDSDGIAPNNFNSNAGTHVDGHLWFGHDDNGGVDEWDGSQWINHLMGERWFRAVTHDWRGHVWCGEKRGHDDAWGIFIYDGADWENLSEFDGLPWNVVNALTIDNPRGRVWIGHSNPGYDEGFNSGGLTLLQGKLPPQPPSPVEDEAASILTDFRLNQNYPNPFNPETAIHYQLPAVSEVMLNIFNIRGERVRSLVSERQPAGRYSVIWDGRSDSGYPMDSGVYFYRLSAGNRMQMKKMTLLK